MSTLVDTDILIDYLRDQPSAVNYLEGLKNQAFLSAITIGELYQGIRDPAEQAALEHFLQFFEILPIDRDIAMQGGLLCNQFRKSHGVGLADAFIAATALYHRLSLATLNRKHYPMLKNLLIPYLK